MKIYRADASPPRNVAEHVTARTLVSPGRADVRAGTLEQIRLAPAARLPLQREGDAERWFYVTAGTGEARIVGADTQPLVTGGLLWLGQDQGCVVVNTGSELLELIEVRA